MHTSGLILDAQDDPEVSQEELPVGFSDPAFSKLGGSLSEQTLQLLPDEVFALVLSEGGALTSLRKYACVDAHTTAFSVAAFLKHGHKLQAHHWEGCAENLRDQCSLYGLPDPGPLFAEKAAGLGMAVLNHAAKNPGRALMMATTVPSVAKGTKENIQNNLEEVRFRERNASLVVRPLAKEAEHFALPSERRYPLDTYEQVIRASDYFGEHCWSMSPEGRREYAVNFAKRASALGIPCPTDLADYASSDYAPVERTLAALHRRREYLSASDDPFLDKLASARGELEPEEFREALSAFDKAVGLDHLYSAYLPDPYRSTYGVKQAEEFREQIGKTDTITERDLENAARNRRSDVCQVFSKDFADRFFKEPVAAYKSLPFEQKKLLARIAGDTAPRG